MAFGLRADRRRRIVAALPCLLVAILSSRPAPCAEGKPQDARLAEKAREFQSLVEDKMAQRHGLIPMFVRAHDYQLPTAADYQGSYRHRHLRGKTEADLGMPPAHVWRAWEDTPSNTAIYLRAVAYQYRVTGDPKDLAICRRSLAGLKYIYSLAVEKGERGFLCKPYGGEYSNQTSGDQLQCVAWGLAGYRPIAPPDDLADIDAMTRDFAAHAIKTDYIPLHGYFGRSADDLRREARDKPLSWNRAAIFLPILYLAWYGSGDSQFAREIERITKACEGQEYRAPTGHFSSTGFGGRRDLYLPAMLMGMDPLREKVWRGAMASNFEQVRTGVLPDGTAHTFWDYEDKIGKAQPAKRAEFSFGYGRTGRSALIAMGCVAAQRWLPKDDLAGEARKILNNLNADTLRFILPLDDKTPLPQEWQVESNMLDGDSLTGWLCAYWEGRYHGYW